MKSDAVFKGYFTAELAEFIENFGDDMDESPYWQYHDPESVPGRLKQAGLLFAGKLDEQEGAGAPKVPVGGCAGEGL